MQNGGLLGERHVFVRDCCLLLNRDVDNNAPDPPLPIVIVIGRPPQLLSDALPLLWWVQNARCMHIHTFLAPAAGSF